MKIYLGLAGDKFNFGGLWSQEKPAFTKVLMTKRDANDWVC